MKSILNKVQKLKFFISKYYWEHGDIIDISMLGRNELPSQKDDRKKFEKNNPTRIQRFRKGWGLSWQPWLANEKNISIIIFKFTLFLYKNKIQ